MPQSCRAQWWPFSTGQVPSRFTCGLWSQQTVFYPQGSKLQTPEVSSTWLVSTWLWGRFCKAADLFCFLAIWQMVPKNKYLDDDRSKKYCWHLVLPFSRCIFEAGACLCMCVLSHVLMLCAHMSGCVCRREVDIQASSSLASLWLVLLVTLEFMYSVTLASPQTSEILLHEFLPVLECKCVPLCRLFAKVLRIEPRFSCLYGSCFTNWPVIPTSFKDSQFHL